MAEAAGRGADGERASAGRGARRAVAAGVALGLAVGWNATNVGAVADELARAYGASLSLVGLLTTALFLGQAALTLPAGALIDERGARQVALGGLAVLVAGNLVALAAAEEALGIAARVAAGAGAALAGQASAVLVRGSGSLGEGLQGSAQVAGAGLALAVLPHLVGALEWRAPFVTALAVTLAAVPFAAAARGAAAAGEHRPLRSELAALVAAARDTRVLRWAAIFAATVGVGTAAGNWIVPLLTRTDGVSAKVAGLAGAMIFVGGVVSRPLAGELARRRPATQTALVTAGLALAGTALLLVAADLPIGVHVAAIALFGIAAGLPFGVALARAAEARADAPGDAIAVVNMANLLVAMAGVPLIGLTFGLAGEGRWGFVGAGVAVLLALVLVRAGSPRRAPAPRSRPRP